MTDHCRDCHWAEPTGRGNRGGKDVDIGLCHGDTPSLTHEYAGAFVPVSLDIDWCRHFTPRLPTKRKTR